LVNYNLNVKVEKGDRGYWRTKFTARVVRKDKVIAQGHKKNVVNPVAVCMAVPYTSFDTEKADANGAMMIEAIRYYAKLNFKVIVYDRDGANRHHIYNSSYAKAQKTGPLELVYHNYTIRGLLHPEMRGFKYDNTEVFYENDKKAAFNRKSRFESQGHDKTQTFTQCRFEAKALYGIDTVLILDFDEFLYCPVAEANAKAQSDYMHQFFSFYRRMGVDQIMFPQRLVSNVTQDPRDCIVDKVKRGKSIFECYAPFEYYMGGHSVKSLHLGHKCPLTGYHQACPGPDAPRSYDCVCENKHIRQNPWRPFEPFLKGRECAVVHLSTQKSVFSKYKFNEKEIKMMKETPNELLRVVRS